MAARASNGFIHTHQNVAKFSHLNAVTYAPAVHYGMGKKVYRLNVQNEI